MTVKKLPKQILVWLLAIGLFWGCLTGGVLTILYVATGNVYLMVAQIMFYAITWFIWMYMAFKSNILREWGLIEQKKETKRRKYLALLPLLALPMNPPLYNSPNDFLLQLYFVYIIISLIVYFCFLWQLDNVHATLQRIERELQKRKQNY